jgi:hypothetical protein
MFLLFHKVLFRFRNRLAEFRYQVTPPKFLKDTLDLSDIEGSRTHIRINQFGTRDHMNKLPRSYVFVSAQSLTNELTFESRFFLSSPESHIDAPVHSALRIPRLGLIRCSWLISISIALVAATLHRITSSSRNVPA